MNNRHTVPFQWALHPAHSNRANIPTLATTLDRLADLELQHGHHTAAEHLARQAAALREAGQ